MYFPYLFDKQSELLALRELAGKLGSPQMIIPLVEPVTKVAGLRRFHAAFKQAGNFAYVVENPNLLDLAIPAALSEWQSGSAPLFADSDVFRPVFKEQSST